MRCALVIILSIPLLADTPSRSFYVDVHRFSPDLSGYFQGVQDNQPISFDVQGDLDLQKSGNKVGGLLEYQGPRFGVELSTDGQDYKGSHRLEKTITIDGQDYSAGVDVNSRASIQSSTFNWTIRFIKPDPWWVGVDLGARVWKLDLTANGYDPTNQVSIAPAQESITLPIPQIGLSGGFHAFDGRLVAKAAVHVLSYKGANYTHTLVDLRAFPISWLGVRVFMDNESFKVPKGSIKDDLEFHLDRKGIGFGLIARF